MHLNRRCGLASALLSIALAACGSPPKLQPPGLSFSKNGIFAIAHGPDGTTYLGGTFTQVSALTGGGVPLDRISGQPRASFPQVEGGVFAVVPDGKGGWYIGGSFRSVAGVERHNLAHLTSDKELDPSWAPKVDGQVWALAVRDGQLLLGGDFSHVGDASRASLAALDPTGAVTGWDPSPNGSVSALLVNGNTLYVGGSFDTIAGADRSNLADFDGSGTLSAWDPSPDSDVRSLVIKGTNLYVGGAFKTVKSGGITTARAGLASFALGDGALTDWSPAMVDDSGATPEVWVMAALGDTLYVGGSFTGFGSRTLRSCLAAFDASGSLIQSWSPSVENKSGLYASVYTMTVSGSTLYVGGYFDFVGGEPRSYAAAVDATTGAVADWDPRLDGSVSGIQVAGETVYVGGEFTGLGGVRRNGLAALAPDGSLKSWDPGVSHRDQPGTIYTILVDGDVIYVGGIFDTIGGKARENLAAVDRSGAVLPWDPGISGSLVQAMAAGTDAIYVAGLFDHVGGAARSNLAGIDRKGQVTPWNPVDVTYSVSALLVSGTDVYCAGSSSSGSSTSLTHSLYRYASASSTPVWKVALSGNGTATALALAVQDQPQPDGTTKSVNTLYLGGSFQGVGAVGQKYLAAVDAEIGTPLVSFTPVVDNWVEAMAVADGTLYVGGRFAHVGNQPRSLAAFDLTGVLQDWNPLVYDVWSPVIGAISVAPGVLDVGGSITSVNGQLSGNYARVSR